jgi:hypothetical protein
MVLAGLLTFICVAVVGVVAASNGDAKGWAVFSAYVAALLAIIITTVVLGRRNHLPVVSVALRAATAVLVPQLMVLPFVAVVMAM